MHGKSLTIAICLMASSAMAQGPAAAGAAGMQPAPQLIQASLNAGAPAGAARTREPGPPAQPATPVQAAAQQAEEESSPALPMLLAALALMTGIALRRRDPGAQ